MQEWFNDVTNWIYIMVGFIALASFITGYLILGSDPKMKREKTRKLFDALGEKDE